MYLVAHFTLTPFFLLILGYSPTLEDIRSWADSFDKLMKHKSKCSLSLVVRQHQFISLPFPAGRRIFREFLKCEYSEENMMFWLACEDLRNLNDREVIEEQARQIYDNFISILSPREVGKEVRPLGVHTAPWLSKAQAFLI